MARMERCVATLVPCLAVSYDAPHVSPAGPRGVSTSHGTDRRPETDGRLLPRTSEHRLDPHTTSFTTIERAHSPLVHHGSRDSSASQWLSIGCRRG